MRRRTLAQPPDPAPAHGPAGAARRGERTCIAGGGSAPPTGLVRFALSPDGVVTPDLSAKLPGRGAWVEASRAAIEKAAARGLFARAFRREARAPEGLADLVEAGLEKRALSAIGLARRAGAAAVGFDQAAAAARAGAVCVISAADAADGGAEKLARAARAGRIVRAFSVASLSAALGKDGVRHIALSKGQPADRFLEEATRLSGFRPVFAPSAPDAEAE